MTTKILIIEDDPSIGKLLRRALLLEGYEARLVKNGLEGISAFHEENPDLIILDLMLPGIDGIEVCKRIREDSDTPILMLTARDTVEDRVLGLDSGADDYVVKPFSPPELISRIHALLRRTQNLSTDNELSFADRLRDRKSTATSDQG